MRLEHLVVDILALLERCSRLEMPQLHEVRRLAEPADRRGLACEPGIVARSGLFEPRPEDEVLPQRDGAGLRLLRARALRLVAGVVLDRRPGVGGVGGGSSFGAAALPAAFSSS